MGDRSAAAGLALALALVGCDTRPPSPPSATPTEASSAAPPPAPPLAEDAGPVACGEAADASEERRKACLKDWTVLIYMAADNDDLPPYAYRNLEEIESPFPDPNMSAASTASLDVAVELDLKTPPGIQRLHMVRAPADGKPLPDAAARTPGDIRSPAIALPEDESSSPAESLSRFLSWGIQRYPSRHVMIVVWGHGLGFRQAGEKEGSRYKKGSLKGGVAFDDSQGSVLDTPSLRAALAEVSTRDLGGRPFDIYASDACLMQSLEVTGELADVARFIVGSEQKEPYIGLPYRTFLPALNGAAPLPASARCEKDDPACAVAAALPPLAKANFDLSDASRPENERGSYTLSTIDSRALTGVLYPELRRLAAALGAYFREKPERTEGFVTLLGLPTVHADPDKSPMPDFLGGTRDVGILLRRIDLAVQQEAARSTSTAKGDAVREAVKSAGKALERTIIAASLGARYDAPAYAGHAGVSVWVPHLKAELAERVASFASSRLYAALEDKPADGWKDWIEMVWKPPKRQK